MIDSTFDRDNQTFSPSKKTLYPKPSTLDRVWHLSLPAFTGCGPLLQMERPTLGSHTSHLPFFTLPKLYPTWIRLALVWLVLRPTVGSTLKEGKLGKDESHFGVESCDQDGPSWVGKWTILWQEGPGILVKPILKNQGDSCSSSCNPYTSVQKIHKNQHSAA